MKKYLFSLTPFLVGLILCLSLSVTSAAPRIDGGESGGGGYSNVYYGGTFPISNPQGDAIMGLNHYVYANINDTLIENDVTIYYSAYYPNFATYPTIASEEVNSSSRFAWVNAKTYFSAYEANYYYGQHGFYCNAGNKL